MKNFQFQSYFIIFISFLAFFSTTNATNNNNSSCPIDFTYVQTFPWYTKDCLNNNAPHDHNVIKTCCQTLRSLLGIGLALYLKNSSNFYLPSPEFASSCLSLFESQLATLSIDLPIVPNCLTSSTELLNQPTGCAGIKTTKDWTRKAGPTTQLDASCKGDMRSLAQCSSCLDAGMKVTSDLVSLSPNSTKCFFYTIFYAAGIVNVYGPEDTRAAACILGIPLASDTGHDDVQSSRRLSQVNVLRLVIALVGAIMGVFIVIASIYAYYIIWNKRRKEKEVHERFVRSVRAQVSPNVGATWYRVDELERATNGFSQKKLIGQGGFGVVYKGELSNGSVVAVKEITQDSDSFRDEEFYNEVDLISKIRHRNLLSLRGCCVSSDDFRSKRRYLVYDYMTNGSLSDHLFNPQKRLTWPQRKNIILDVAKGLAYLHYGIKPAIYHRDIKTTNILLDSDMKARVADFGLAKQTSEGQSHLTTRVAGTYGYLAPEYALYGQLTEKSDVYSFGIVVLETMSGKMVLDTTRQSTPLIADHAWDLVKSKNINSIFDESIRNEGPKGIMERFVKVGILCAHVMVAFRPTIAQALKMLEGDIDIPKLPDRPLPLSHESFRSSIWHSIISTEGSFKS